MTGLDAVAVIGLGSMGKRRVRILRRRFPEISVVGIDLDEGRRKTFGEEFSLPAYETLDEAMEVRPDAAVISTSPLSHAGIVTSCLERSLHVFTELNLSPAGYDRNIALAKQAGKVLFLSSTFLYRREVQYLREQVKAAGCALDYSYHVGQYLPDWHPWEDYRDFFVAKRESNACREIFAIELPWLMKVFGSIESVQVMSDKMSKLDIPYHDNYLVMLRHRNGHKGILLVDVVSREAVRDFTAFGENLFVKWDGTPEGIVQKDIEEKELRRVSLYGDEMVIHDENYSRNVIENAYENEICAFMDAIQGIGRPEYTYEDDGETLAWIDKIEEGMK